MATPQILYTCTNCDAQFQKWVGRCLECGKWGTVEQDARHKVQDTKKQAVPISKTQKLGEIKATKEQRIDTTITELNRVLGGGVVPGSLVLLGGEPGIGKSTLSLQLATKLPNVLYISGEESVHQVKMRADRLQTNTQGTTLQLTNETDIDVITETIRSINPTLAIIDSIQTMHSGEVTGSPGAPNQIRACTTKLLEVAKGKNIPIVIIGHVTKDGSVAGPKLLEHLVDTVLYFEGDSHHNLRILRAVKNRFGSTDEVGMFEMTGEGLQEVLNPSEHLLEERGENMPGSVVTCLLEGTRPLLVEVQALVNKTVFGYPQRKASGFDLNRLHVLSAVLQRRANLNLSQYDIHINIVGGIKADEPAVDLAVCIAIASAYKDKALGKDLVVFGEVGLGGEVRSVQQVDRRIRECEQLGMKRVMTRVRKKMSDSKIAVRDVKDITALITTN